LKLSAAKFNNFGKFETFECKFGDEITRLVGLNGAGKTTVGLKGLMACVNGIAESASGGKLLGERFRFIGKAGKSADVAYQFSDNGETFWIKNHITANGNNITFKSDGDTPINDEWLKGFLNVALMSAKNFCQLSGREQARALGIDTSNFDTELKNLKAEYTLINRDLKNMGEIAPVEKVESVDVSVLKVKKEEIRKALNDKYLENKAANKKTLEAFNKVLAEEQKAIKKFNAEQEARKEKIDKAAHLEVELTALGYLGKEVGRWIQDLPDALPLQDENDLKSEEPKYIEEMPDDAGLVAVDAQIEAANTTNEKARDYLKYLSDFAKKEAKKKELANNDAKQEESIKARNVYMSGFKFGFEGLTTDADGCLLLKDRPLTESYFSKGELEMIVARLHASINPSFKTRFIDDFNLIDKPNQEKLLKELFEAGFQVITAEVGEKSDKENSIVLRECKIVTGEEEGKKLL
jgi:hypothetical protein